MKLEDELIKKEFDYLCWMDEFVKELSNNLSLLGNMGQPIIKSEKLTEILDRCKAIRKLNTK